MFLRNFIFIVLIFTVSLATDISAQKPVKREKHRTGQKDVIKDGDQNWGVRQGKRKGSKISRKGRKYTNSKEAGKSKKVNQKRYENPKKRVTKKRFHSKKAKEDKEKFDKEINNASKEMKKEDKARRKRSKQTIRANRKIPDTQKIPRRSKGKK